jgi:hypothetical protein
MKKYLVLIVLLFTSLQIFSQTIYYGYDEAGNRRYRGPDITLKSTETNSLNQDENLKEEFEESFDNDLKVIIYPNPTRGELKIELQGYEDNMETYLYLFSMSGSLLISKSSFGQFEVLNLSPYPNATYILKLIIGKKATEWRIIKE